MIKIIQCYKCSERKKITSDHKQKSGFYNHPDPKLPFWQCEVQGLVTQNQVAQSMNPKITSVNKQIGISFLCQ